jgi:hypothetical protein
MFAPRPMARFATGLPGELRVFDVHTRVRAGRKYPCNIRMTLRTSVIPDISCAWNFRRRNYRPRQSRTRDCEKHNEEQAAKSGRHRRNLSKSTSHFNFSARSCRGWEHGRSSVHRSNTWWWDQKLTEQPAQVSPKSPCAKR